MNIRKLLEENKGIPAELTRPGVVAISIDDLQQLAVIAHEAIHSSRDKGPLERAFEEIFPQVADKEGPEDPEENTSVETGYDQEQTRNVSMHYAVQIAVARIHSQHGLETEPVDPVAIAVTIENYLVGKK